MVRTVKFISIKERILHPVRGGGLAVSKRKEKLLSLDTQQRRKKSEIKIPEKKLNSFYEPTAQRT